MPQLINLSEFNGQKTKSTSLEHNSFQMEDLIPSEPLLEIDSLKLLREMYPNQILFNLEETASIINVSYEFIRSRANYGLIPSVLIGNRRMIHLTTINTLINKGI